MIGYESAPFPSKFCPVTVTLMPLGGGKHEDEDTWKITVQIPLTQEEAGTVIVPQIFPVIELLKLIK